MTSLADIEARIEALGAEAREPARAAAALLALGEEVLEHWLDARGETPTAARREGFRLLALHRQGARGDPSFNACRESCRELAYRYNLIVRAPDGTDRAMQLRLAAMVAMHLCLFVRGKLEQSALGEFCCSSRPLRANA
jgi:hypothetical protein